MDANINYIETVSPLLYLYLHNCTQPQEKKEFYLAVYETATQIIMLNPCPMYQLQFVSLGTFIRRNYIAFLYTHFASDFASDLSLAEEITQSSFVDSIIVLLDRMNTAVEPEMQHYAEHQINDENVDIVGLLGKTDS